MRISSTLFFQTGLNSINAQQADLMHLYQQVGSGQRMVTPADDPLAAAQAINISQSQSLNQRFADNREVAKRNLGTSENALNSVTTLIQDVKTQLVAAGNGTMSDADRATLSDVLKHARTSLLGLANSTDGNGQYLFSGSRGGTAAFQDVNGKIEYMGDRGQRNIQADQTRQIAGSDVGSDIFNRAAPGANGYLTRAVVHTGTGVMSTPTITDANGENIGRTFTITFTAPDTYGIDIYDAAGNLITVDANGDPLNLNNLPYVAGQSDVLTLPGGVQVKLSGQPAAGDTFKVEPASSPDYVASATTSTGSALIGSPSVYDYSLARDGDVFSIKFTSPTTYDVVVNNGGVEVGRLADQVFVPGRENTLTLPRGMQVKMSGAPVLDDEFEIQAAHSGVATDLNIFDTLDSIIQSLATSLQSPEATAKFQNTLASAMQRLDINYNNVLTVRSSVGARLNELDALDANGALRNLNYRGQLSQLEDLDYYTASMQLELRKSALEAAALAFRKIQGTSLFNMGAN